MTETERDLRNNPLLDAAPLPDFPAIEAQHVEPAVRHVLAQQRRQLERAVATPDPTCSWLTDIERIHANVHDVWGPIVHLNSVRSTPALRDAFNRCLPLITEFETEFAQDAGLYRQFATLSEKGAEAAPEIGQLIAHNLRDFRLAGVALAPPARARFRELMLALAERQARFEQNLMDATDEFVHHETDPAAVAGLPEVLLARAAADARNHGLDGWRLTLDSPTYQAVLTHAESTELRALFYRAWVTRASEQGPYPERWDNGPLIEEILGLRHEAARLLGFANFAEMSLATKMAETPDEVVTFLEDLARRTKANAEQEFERLQAFAGRNLAAWDIAYYSERLKNADLGLAEEALRPYLPLPRVLAGLFELATRLFGISVIPSEGAQLWHPDAQRYSILDPGGTVIGTLLTDLFARPQKRGGAWMDGCTNRARLVGLSRDPAAYLVCNFAPPVGTDPALLTHTDVVTLFHEFGHSLHHLLTEVDYPSIAGINGVPWDAVELPSQFMENYAWEPHVLAAISSHFQTGAPLPADQIATLNSSRTFLAGLAMMRQLEFALFDFRIHSGAEAQSAVDVARILGQVRDEIAVVKHPGYNRFQCSFAHIFGGGYAAGYYSYKWAEVLAADAFAAFSEGGIYDASTAARFRESILAVGGSRPALQAFVDFRGRPPSIEPLLRQSGIAL
jgi:oligopeptidase A